jgi:hypothetical protein
MTLDKRYTYPLLTPNSSRGRREQIRVRILIEGAQIIGDAWDRIDAGLKAVGFSLEESREILRELSTIENQVVKEQLDKVQP